MVEIKIKPKDIQIENECEAKTPMDKLLIKIADISVTYPKQIILEDYSNYDNDILFWEN